MGINDFIFKSDFEDIESATTEIYKQFLHMNEQKDNILYGNELIRRPRCACFISPHALKRLIGIRGNGWLDDEVINFMAELCNFYQIYIPKTNKFKEKLSSCVIGKAGDENH